MRVPVDEGSEVVCAAGGGVGADAVGAPLVDAHLHARTQEQHLHHLSTIQISAASAQMAVK